MKISISNGENKYIEDNIYQIAFMDSGGYTDKYIFIQGTDEGFTLTDEEGKIYKFDEDMDLIK